MLGGQGTHNNMQGQGRLCGNAKQAARAQLLWPGLAWHVSKQFSSCQHWTRWVHCVESPLFITAVCCGRSYNMLSRQL